MSWSFSLLGTSGIYVDWYGLSDPLRTWLPIFIQNNDNFTLYFQGDLSGGHSIFTTRFTNYSGQQLGSIGSRSNTALKMIWDWSSSGAASPYSGTAALKLTAFTSSNYTGERFSVVGTYPLIYFNRDSHIKVFGDDYNENFNPRPSVSGTSGGTFVSGQRLWWAVSYVKSGWESDPSSATPWVSGGLGDNPFSGARYTISWSGIAGASQYFVWRWSGDRSTVNLRESHVNYSGPQQAALQSPNDGGMELNPMDLIYASNQTSVMDNNLSPIKTGIYRHANFQTYYDGGGFAKRVGAGSATESFLSSGASRNPGFGDANISLPNTIIDEHAYPISENLSGTLSGPRFCVIHKRADENDSFHLHDGLDARQKGFQVAPGGLFGGTSAITSAVSGTWFRLCVQIPNYNSSGYFHLQLVQDRGTGESTLAYVDDVFIVAFS